DRGGAAGVAAGAGAAGAGAGVLAAGAAGVVRGAEVCGGTAGAAACCGPAGGSAAAGAGAAGAPPAAGATARNVMVPSSWRALPAGAAGPAPPAAAGAAAAGSAAAPSASGADASGALGSEPQEILRSCPPPKPDWRERSAPHAEAGSGRLPCWDSAADGEGAGEGDGTEASGAAGAGAAARGCRSGRRRETLTGRGRRTARAGHPGGTVPVPDVSRNGRVRVIPFAGPVVARGRGWGAHVRRPVSARWGGSGGYTSIRPPRDP